MREHTNYLYEDDITGEMFYVQADNRYEADLIAEVNFEEPHFIREDNDYIAELYGYDTCTE